MSKFMQHGSVFHVKRDQDLPVLPKLPAGNYTILFDMEQGFFLRATESFSMPPKFYGSLTGQRDRIIGSFKDRPAATGVLLNGEKGSGKTLLAKAISLKLAEEGMPTLIVNAPYTGDPFYSFLQSIDQPCVVLFDEFEKVYNQDKGQQEEILTLLDGTYPQKKLYLLTCNDKWRLDTHLKNRPGRVYYFLDFKGLEEKFIRDYCEDNLRSGLKTHTDKLVTLAKSFKAFNFDMLKAVVEEMNRYCEEPKDALRLLNIKPDDLVHQTYGVELTLDGVKVKRRHILSKTFRMDPSDNFHLNVNYVVPATEEDKKRAGENLRKRHEAASKTITDEEIERILASVNQDKRFSITFSNEHFVRMDAKTRGIVFVVKKDPLAEEDDMADYAVGHFKEAEITLTPIQTPPMEYTEPYSFL